MQVDAQMVLNCLTDMEQKCTDLMRKYTLNGIDRPVNKYDVSIALIEMQQEADKLRTKIIEELAASHAS